MEIVVILTFGIIATVMILTMKKLFMNLKRKLLEIKKEAFVL